MKRRGFLRGAVTIPALAAGIPAAAIARDPHPEWLRQWRRLRDVFNGIDNEGPEYTAVWEQMGNLEEMICVTPATTAAGILAQLQFAMPEHGGYIETGNVWKDLDSRLFNNIAASLEAAA